MKSRAKILIGKGAGVFLLAALTGLLFGCGVRGDPQPPLTPTELGHGKPSFKRSTEEFAFPEVPSPEPSATPRRRTLGE